MDNIVIHAVLFAPGIEQFHCENWLILNSMPIYQFHKLGNGALASIQITTIELSNSNYEFYQIYIANKDVKLILYKKKNI